MQPVEIIDPDDLPSLAVDDGAQRLLAEPGGGMLLEEALARGALRATHQRQRPSDHMRRHPVPDRAIIVGEVLLGDADIHPIDPVGMGEPHVIVRRRVPCLLRRCPARCRHWTPEIFAAAPPDASTFFLQCWLLLPWRASPE